jgi:RHS repeat-associated protein
MVATARPTPPSPAGPPAQGRSASRSASDRRGAIEALPENEVVGRLACHRPAGAVAAHCIARPRSHRRDSHPGRRRFSGRPRGGRYSWARYYHPHLARFIAEDPIGFHGSSANLYEYVNEMPTSHTDPLGLMSATFGFAVGVGGSFTFGIDSQGWFVEGTAGFGLGLGLSVDPKGTFSPPDNSAIGYGGFNAQASIGWGGANAGVSGTAAAVVPPSWPYTDTWSNDLSSASRPRGRWGGFAIAGFGLGFHSGRFDRATAGRGDAYPPRPPVR